ncbi:MAG: hypothetical protein PHC28_06015 [Flavobacterium sp.]|uniref:hypothetical protein n=1 Tax=Flavobacterium sp. TaxID=239 RepID=UPI00260EED35|nr:hypothetical protein [Flavobacterium sp.]MDD5150025.1 hypothetical protein [Flavobacterium sp.]
MQINRKLLLLLFLVFSKPTFSQELTTKKISEQYPTTTTWDFICENYALTGITKIQIAKTDKGGTLKLTVQTTNPSFKIVGTLYVYLSDNSIIVCTDKGIQKNIDDQIISYYTFSAIEMNKLKKSDIQSLRFNIAGNPKKFSSQIGNFSAFNKKTTFKTDNNTNTVMYNTAKEIIALYN